MPDELRPDDIPDLWRQQPRDPLRMSADAVRDRAREFEARTRRGFRGARIIMICAAACYALFVFAFPGILQRIGSTLTLAAYLYCLYRFRSKGAVNKLLAEAPAATCAAYKAELERVRDYSLISNAMAPFILGPAIFVMGFLIPAMGVWAAVALTTALIASPFALAAPLVTRKRRMLDREIRSLDALMR